MCEVCVNSVSYRTSPLRNGRWEEIEFRTNFVTVDGPGAVSSLHALETHKRDSQKETYRHKKRPTKETHKRDQYKICVWRLSRDPKNTNERDPQKRPTKETHKRDPQKRPTKETHKRDLLRNGRWSRCGQLAPYIRDPQMRLTKETYRHEKRPTKQTHKRDS